MIVAKSDGLLFFCVENSCQRQVGRGLHVPKRGRAGLLMRSVVRKGNVSFSFSLHAAMSWIYPGPRKPIMETMSDPSNEYVCRPSNSDCMFCRNLKKCKKRKDAPSVSDARVLRHAYPPD